MPNKTISLIAVFLCLILPYHGYSQCGNVGSRNPCEELLSTGCTVPSGEKIIRVVVHIVLPDPKVISDSDIREQIELLDHAFNGTLPTINSLLDPLRVNSNIKFEIADNSYGGKAITRTYYNGKKFLLNTSSSIPTGIVGTIQGKRNIGTIERIKETKAGGHDPWDTERYLNIWVGDIASRNENGVINEDLVGFAHYPWAFNKLWRKKSKVDGVVVDTSAFGPGMTTLVHEVGHYFGLLHPWDNGSGFGNCCNDCLGDTPDQYQASNNCGGTCSIPFKPSSSETCPGTTIDEDLGQAFYNFMDFAQEDLRCLFTPGQVERMLCNFGPSGSRQDLLLPPPIQSGAGDGAEPNDNLPSAPEITYQANPLNQIGDDMDRSIRFSSSIGKSN
ncbi:MAG: M43 family zinc metalloprotease, partial [Bacteroidota bacterium]